MAFRYKRLAAGLAAAFLLCSLSARAAFEQPCESWAGCKPGTPVGDGVERDGAVVDKTIVTTFTSVSGTQAPAPAVSVTSGTTGTVHKGPAPAPRPVAAVFSFAFPPVAGVKVLEAERARLAGPTRYNDVLASGGRAVGGLGGRIGSAIAFDNVPASAGLTVYYNHTVPHGWRSGAGPTSTTQCGLYIDDRRTTTIRFNDPGGWFTLYDAALYEGKLGASVRLQADAEDAAKNKGPCANIDRVVVGPPHLLPSLEVRLKVESAPLQKDMDCFGLAIRAPRGFYYQLGLEDGAAVQHWSRPSRHQRENGWENVTMALADFRPRIDPAKADPARGGSIKAILIRATGDETGLKGVVAVGPSRFCAGWPSSPPAGIPLPKSEDFAGVLLTGRHRGYTTADTWYPVWAGDGNLYSSFTDGLVGDVMAVSCKPDATTGMARIEGNDPLKLKVVPIGTYVSRPWPYFGRYPCAMLIHNDVWYYGTAITNNNSPDGDGACQGPFVGFRTSKDLGKTWTETPRTPLNNLFEETVDLVAGGVSRVKMSSPHFVDFGQNMKHSPDGKAYLVAHGCAKPGAPQTWVRGDQIYLARVTPSPQTINNRSTWEFYAGADPKGEPKWSRKFGEIRPLLNWPGRTGCVTVTYDAPLKKYLMCVSNGETSTLPFDTYILEAERLTGPWRLVTYMEQFGKQAYFVNIPSKFISADGRTMWLAYTANWNGYPQNPAGSYYGLCLQEMKLVAPEAPPVPVVKSTAKATTATATVTTATAAMKVAPAAAAVKVTSATAPAPKAAEAARPTTATQAKNDTTSGPLKK